VSNLKGGRTHSKSEYEHPGRYGTVPTVTESVEFRLTLVLYSVNGEPEQRVLPIVIVHVKKIQGQEEKANF